MNREEAIEWCRNYLPQWPDLNSDLKKLARPLGWNWFLERLPYQKHPELILTTGVETIAYVGKDHVWIPMPAVPPVYPEHVKSFLDSVKKVKESPTHDNQCQILLSFKDFNNLYNDYPPFKKSCNDIHTSTMIDNILIKVVNDDILIINEFIYTNQHRFKVFCEEKGVNPNRVIETLLAN